MRIFLCLIILLTTAIFPISAQHFFEFGVENGLSDRKVISIQRDLQGFTWLLTNSGRQCRIKPVPDPNAFQRVQRRNCRKWTGRN